MQLAYILIFDLLVYAGEIESILTSDLWILSESKYNTELETATSEYWLNCRRKLSGPLANSFYRNKQIYRILKTVHNDLNFEQRYGFTIAFVTLRHVYQGYIIKLG